jgi:hypothetical protein
MDVFIIDIFEREFFSGSPDVPVFVPVPTNIPIHRGDQGVATDIEFSLIN